MPKGPPIDSDALRRAVGERISIDELADLYVSLARSPDMRTRLRGAELLARALGLGTSGKGKGKGAPSAGVRLNLRSVLSGGRGGEAEGAEGTAKRRRKRKG